MGHTTIRVSEESRARLRELAVADGLSMTEIIERALEAYRRQRFIEAVNAGYAAVRSDPAEWAAFQAERDEWNATLTDGLVPERWDEP